MQTLFHTIKYYLCYIITSLNIYEYQKYDQPRCYPNRLKNHRYVCIIQSFSYFQLKNFLKHWLNIIIIRLDFLKVVFFWHGWN